MCGKKFSGTTVDAMMKKCILFKNANIVQGTTILPHGYVILDQGKIRQVGTGVPANEQDYTVIDVAGNFLCPGFIDTHCHGGGGHDFMDGSAEAIIGAAKAHLQFGTTTIAPTTLACSDEELYCFIENYKQVSQQTKGLPHFLGIHLEGPHFSLQQAGAQPLRYLKPPSVKFAREIFSRCEGTLARWSLAPELDEALAVGDYLHERQVLVSIAHTDALYEDIKAAVEHGFTHMTHFYSGMSQMRRVNAVRMLGAVECGYLMDELDIELIGDGIHLPPELLKLILKCKPHEKITLVTDSMRGAGLPEGPSIIGSLKDGVPCILEDGVAKLEDRSAFAGSIATTDRLVRTMVFKAGVTLPEAVQMVTENVAKLYGIFDSVGSIEAGKRADIVILDDQLEVVSVYVSGTQVR